MDIMAETTEDMRGQNIQGLSVFYFPTFSTCLPFRSFVLPVCN